MGVQKNRLIETVLLSTHNICFGWEMSKLLFCYALLAKGLISIFRKLQSDLKTTKVEEMRQQMEVFYQEIVRLQNSKETGMDKSVR